MKKILLFNLLIGLLILSACSNNHNKDNNKNSITSLVNNPRSANGMDTVSAARKPFMTFKDTLHEFGQIHAGEVVTYDFTFTNTGKTPLVITNAYGSCGCTVPSYPREAIAPGASNVIKVTFNSAGKEGHQNKTVYIRTNTLRSTENLYITAEVGKKQD